MSMSLASTARAAGPIAKRPSGGAAIASWIAQVACAAIFFQTLFFKFTYAPETRVIFERLGGRPVATAVGFAELACAVLLLVPRTVVIGAVLSLGTIAGALASHLFVLGLVIVDPVTGRGDGGLLFGLAVTVAVLSLAILALRRRELRVLVARLAGR